MYMSGAATQTRANKPPKTAPKVRYSEEELLDTVDGAVTTEPDDGDGDGVGVDLLFEVPAVTEAIMGKVAWCTDLAAKRCRK